VIGSIFMSIITAANVTFNKTLLFYYKFKCIVINTGYQYNNYS